MSRATSTPPELPGLEFVRPLGAGGFSDVFLYDQQLPKRRVAVKVLLTDGLNPAARQAFVDEANLMAQLSAHPYIVTIFHADVSRDDRPYFVMEYCSGPSLSELYKKQPFTVAVALRTGIRLSSAIATAHAAGILHRDIKPANVLTNDFGWPALTDFGISSAVEDELPSLTTTTTGSALRDGSGATESQSVGMSVPWSPPEMFEDAPRPDVRSDVFSLAATIYTLLAGRTPFEIPGRSNGTLDLMGRIERGAITPLSRDDVPRSLVSVLQKGMATRRTDRYSSAIDFARALQRIELELGYSTTTIEVPNLDVKERAAAEDSNADETRVRPISTIVAQAGPVTVPPASLGSPTQADETRVRPITVIAPPPVAGTPRTAPEGTVLRDPRIAADETVHRPRRIDPEPEVAAAATKLDVPTEASTATAAPTVAAQTLDEAPTKRRPIAAIIAVVVIVVVAAAVVIGILVSGASPHKVADPAPGSSGGGESALTGTIPIPVLVSTTPVRKDSAVDFTWKNPAPESGDTFRWSRAENPGASQPLTRTTITVTRPSKGARVCIDIVVQRDGQSGQALVACNPK